MSRMEQFTAAASAPAVDGSDDAAMAQWLGFGRAAMFFCIWAAMAIPVLLVISARLAG